MNFVYSFFNEYMALLNVSINILLTKAQTFVVFYCRTNVNAHDPNTLH